MELFIMFPLMIGLREIIPIVLLFVILFGAKKIPELMRGAGRGVKEFKDALNKDYTEEDKKGDDSKKENLKS